MTPTPDERAALREATFTQTLSRWYPRVGESASIGDIISRTLDALEAAERENAALRAELSRKAERKDGDA